MTSNRIVFIRDNYSQHLVARFYKELLVPCFERFIDELEDFEVFDQHIQQDLPDVPYRLHIALIIDDNTDEIKAGASFEYYPKSSCGLLTYIVVAGKFRRQGLARQLSDVILSKLYEDAGIACLPLNAVFLETNSDKIPADQDVMVPRLRRQVLKQVGFNILDFDYVQPPLSEVKGKCRDLHLAVHKSFCDSGGRGMHACSVAAWIKEFYEVLMGEEGETDYDLINIEKQLSSSTYVSVIDP
jgi:GNAT superfamily N-acetyltransferase